MSDPSTGPGGTGLLRVTAVAGGRRSDLAVPGGVAVAELVPDLARAVGLLDPAAVYAGYRLHAHGRRLRPGLGLREQGVEDGALLAVVAGVDDAPPTVHDDLPEAVADLVARQRAWRPEDTRRTTLAAALVAVAIGLGVLAWQLAREALSSWSPPTGWPTPATVAAVVLSLAVLAGNVLPTLAVSAGVGRAGGAPVDLDQVDAMVNRSGRLLAVGSVTVAGVAVLTVPVVADTPAGVLLSCDCCLVLLLRARRHRALVPALIAAVGGLLALLTVAVAVLLRQPEPRPALAAGLAGAGLVVGALTRLPAPPVVWRARALDLAEVATLVALAPLLLLATDGLAQVSGA